MSCIPYASHPSIINIRSHRPADFHFDFHPVQPEETLAVLLNLNVLKAVGYHSIPELFLRDAVYIIAQPLTSIFHKMVCMNTFPKCLKYAEVSPVFKKDDPLTKKNYRPVSNLTSLSKVFETLLLNQLQIFTNNIFHQEISAFRPRHGS